MSISEFIYTVVLKPTPLRKLANFAITCILPKTLKVGGATIHLNPDDPVVSGALTLRSYENEEIAFFLRHFTQEMTFVDVGANVGLYTGMALHQSSSHATVLCVEPDPVSRIYLERTIASNRTAGLPQRVAVCPVAASDKKEAIVLYKNSQNKGDNRIYKDPLCDESQNIEADTLDHLCEKHEIDKIDFLKVDVQGAEYKVFAGAASILSRSADCIVMTEFWPYGLESCGSSPMGYLKLLQDLGLELFELSPHKLTAIKNPMQLIQQCTGRRYKNLIGLKGKYRSHLSR